MVISRKQDQGDLLAFDTTMPAKDGFFGVPTGQLGFNWGLAIQIAGWTINGIGLGLSTYEAVKGAKEKSGVETLEPGEVSAIASQIAAADPQHRTATQWESILAGQFGGATAPEPVPPGFYRDPRTGQLVPLITQKAGFLDNVPTWAWVGGGLLAFMYFKGGLKI